MGLNPSVLERISPGIGLSEVGELEQGMRRMLVSVEELGRGGDERPRGTEWGVARGGQMRWNGRDRRGERTMEQRRVGDPAKWTVETMKLVTRVDFSISEVSEPFALQPSHLPRSIFGNPANTRCNKSLFNKNKMKYLNNYIN